MNKIHVLAPSVAERIAAGEVIERPASVVKELVENSLDAGSTEIIVRLEDGGKKFIEVQDNGNGMSSDDLRICIERHATSKLNSLDDLDRIVTLGFRGEALPSVAAVSDLSILSRERNSDSAYELDVGEISARHAQLPQPKKVTFGQFAGLTHGTRVQVRGLFSQVPARLKFLKSQSAEVTQTRDLLERIALAYPQVGFQLYSDNRSVLNLRPQTEKERVHAILSDGEDYPLITISNEQDGLRDLGLQIRIHWIQGLSSPHSRKLIQVVNRRTVRDRVLQQAILSPFRQTLLPGQFPAIALFIEVNPAALDVNVHPTKTEVRFLDSRKVFQSIESLAKEMIALKGAPAIVPKQSEVPMPSVFKDRPRFPERPVFNTRSLWDTAHLSVSESVPTPLTGLESLKQEMTPSPSLAHPGNSITSARKLGILFNTYLLYEHEDQLVLVDQHAAHERIRYESLKKRALGASSSKESQVLLLPETVKFPEESRPILEKRLSWLASWGFDAELFGENILLFRAVPGEWGTRHLKARLKNLIDRVLSVEDQVDRDENSLLLDEALFEAIASEACHSAIRAGDPLEPEEMSALLDQLFQCEHPWNCPHGRPTVVKVARGKVEEWFQRKVSQSATSIEW